MFDFSGISGAYTETSLEIVLFSMIMTIVLSLLLVITYDKTTPILGRSQNFVQSLLLMSIVTATIMQSIGDSLAFSFGIFGALAILRFRSSITDPRDISFIFASMAVGISCGVHSFENAILGTITFCLIILAMRFSPFYHKYNIKGSLRIDSFSDNKKLDEVEKTLALFARNISLSKYKQTNVANEEGDVLGTEFEYVFNVESIKQGTEMQYALNKINGVKISRLIFDDGVFGNNS